MDMVALGMCLHMTSRYDQCPYTSIQFWVHEMYEVSFMNLTLALFREILRSQGQHKPWINEENHLV